MNEVSNLIIIISMKNAEKRWCLHYIVADTVPTITLYPITTQHHQLHHFVLGWFSLS